MKDHDDLEETLFGNKERKIERKIARKTDRSKYKKTDQDKRKKQETKENLLRGRIVAVLPEEIIVFHEESLLICTLKGRLKQERQRVKNLVVVGDFVWFEKEGGIVSVEERSTLLSRRASHGSRKEQIIASNIDCVLITASIKHPPLAPEVIDRYIIAAEKGHLEPVIVINKADLGEAEEIVKLYRELGYTVLCVSAETGLGIEKLKQAMKDKSSLFAGESGVGKSSLINAVADLELPTKEVATKTQKGVHTTTGAKLIPLPFGGWCVDSAGIQSFGLWDLHKDDLVHHFPEIFEKGRECKYGDCAHASEPGCMVLKAVESGQISKLRYHSFRKLWGELAKKS